ncbi:hypothetical protein [Devosia sp. Root685]|uniref:hypothetical protein n=1 Tax=Devosia sp. Root685 TaxID=1736587 RepID=UPI0012E38097|nr:hypothetical protein [Devosia sp. Root685]
MTGEVKERLGPLRADFLDSGRGLPYSADVYRQGKTITQHRLCSTAGSDAHSQESSNAQSQSDLRAKPHFIALGQPVTTIILFRALVACAWPTAKLYLVGQESELSEFTERQFEAAGPLPTPLLSEFLFLHPVRQNGCKSENSADLRN